MGEPVYQVIYTSNTDLPITDAALTKIVHQSQKNNKMSGLTGVLLYEDQEFLQVIEGSEKTVKNTLERISNDYRHKKLSYIHEGFAKRRSFARWTMGFTHLNTSTHPNFNELDGVLDVNCKLSNIRSGMMKVFLTAFLLGQGTKF